MSQEGVDLIRRVFAHTYTEGTYDEVLELYHPDLIYHPRPGDPEPAVHRGRDALRQLISGYVDALSEVTFDVLEVIDAGDYVIASTVLNGRGSASGAEVSEPYVFVYKFRDGLVVEGWEFKTKDEALALTASKQS
jgi:ketosteroid isomerase-like protein